jgi:undecaprenyl-diphosphatase
MVLSGVFVSQGIVRWSETLVFVILGGVLGDAASFYLGKRGVGLFGKDNKIFKLDYLEKGERFFKKYGNKSVFLARFFGPIRPVVPFVAGIFRMRTRTFFVYNILSALLAAPVYVGIGYFFGYNTGRFQHIFGRAGLFGAVLVLLVIGLYLFKRSLVKKGNEFFISLRFFVASILRLLIFRPRIEYFLEHHSKGVNFLRQRKNTFNFFGLPLTLLSVIFFVLLISYFDMLGRLIPVPTVMRFDDMIQIFLSSHRYSFFVYLFWTLTYLASAWMVPFITVGASVIMWWKKRFKYIAPLYIVVVGSVVTTFLLKHFTARPRPFGSPVYYEHLFSFPSLHSVVAVALYGFLAYFLMSQYKNWKTKLNILFITVLLILAIGFSRLYLGVHYFSDVIGGYVLGIVWLWLGISLTRIMRRSHGV